MRRFLLAALLLWPTLAGATDYYVDGSCANSGDGTTLTCGTPGGTGPFKTINSAVTSGTVMQPGNTVHIRGGTYDEPVNIVSKNGTSGSRITIRNYQSETVIVDGTNAVNANCTGSGAPWSCCTGAGTGNCPLDDAGFGVDQSSYITVQGITSRDWPLSGDDAFAVVTSSFIVLDSVIGHDAHTGIYVRNSSDVTVEDSEAYSNRFHGIYPENSDRVTLRRVVAHDQTVDAENDGIHVGNSRDITIEDCVAYNNKEQGVDIGGHCVADNCSANASSQRVTINRCVAYRNSGVNSECVGAGDPFICCTGAAAGYCDAVGGFKFGGYKDDTITVTNSIAWKNGGWCGFCILSGKDVVLDHVTGFGNFEGYRATNCSGEPVDCQANYQTGTVVRNSVFVDQKDGVTVGTSNSSIAMNYNGYYYVVNADCIAANNPANCCTGSGTGACGDDADYFGYKSCTNYSVAQFASYQGDGCISQDANSEAGAPVFVNAADPDGADNVWFTADDGLLLQAGSPFKNSASDGTDMGYAIASLPRIPLSGRATVSGRCTIQ